MAPLVLIWVALAEPGVDLGSSKRSAHLVFVTSSPAPSYASRSVESLRLPELEQEELRLADPPSLIHPAAAFAAGGALLGAGGVMAFWALTQPPTTDGIGPTIVLASAFALMASGAVMAIIGGILLPGIVWARDGFATRRADVRARIATLEQGDPSVHSTHVEEIRVLQDDKPWLVLPVALAATGAVALVVGSVSYGALGARSTDASRGISIGLMVVGLALAGISAMQFIGRFQRRAEIDDQIRALQQPPAEEVPSPAPAPPRASLPPVPNELAFGWRFQGPAY